MIQDECQYDHVWIYIVDQSKAGILHRLSESEVMDGRAPPRALSFRLATAEKGNNNESSARGIC